MFYVHVVLLNRVCKFRLLSLLGGTAMWWLLKCLSWWFLENLLLCCHRLRLLNSLLYSFARLSIKLNGFNYRIYFSQSSGAWESKIKVPVGLMSPKASLSLPCRWRPSCWALDKNRSPWQFLNFSLLISRAENPANIDCLPGKVWYKCVVF